MDSKEEIHSDDGSYELVNSDDYATETYHLNMEAMVSSSMEFSDDSSYDMLCSEVSDMLVLTEDRTFHNEEVKSFSPESENTDTDLIIATDSDTTEERETRSENTDDSDHTEGDMQVNHETDSYSKLQLIPNRGIHKGKKRNLMTMLSETSDMNLLDFPDQIKLSDDIKVVAKNHITCYLPAKTLFRCKLVSKEWNKWISSPFFAHIQSQYFRKTSGFFQNSGSSSPIRFFSLESSAYGIPYPSLRFLPVQVTIKCSCNGLLLCQAFNDENEIYVCNPANRQWVELPDYSNIGFNPKTVLAFEPSSLNFEPYYQVIRLFSPLDPDVTVLHFVIYDSVTKSWRESDTICMDFDTSVIKSDGIFINGVVYWETTGGEILAFDPKNEIYSVEKIPFDDCELSNILGETCCVRAEYDHSLKACVVTMYGDGFMSLKRAVEIPVGDVEDGEVVECRVLGNSCDDVVGLVVKVSQVEPRLYVYHVKDEVVQGPGFVGGGGRLFPYVNSLVCIDA